MASSNAARLGETFELLEHPYRRYVLYYLRTHSGRVDIETLAAMLATELDGPSVMGGRETAAQIEIALHHTHLPHLADAGLITFTQDEQSVELVGMNGHGPFVEEAARIDGYAPPAANE